MGGRLVFSRDGVVIDQSTPLGLHALGLYVRGEKDGGRQHDGGLSIHINRFIIEIITPETPVIRTTDDADERFRCSGHPDC